MEPTRSCPRWREYWWRNRVRRLAITHPNAYRGLLNVARRLIEGEH